MSCPDCFSGTAKTTPPSGTTTKLHGISVYIASPPPTTPPSPSTIIYLPDAFGYTFTNNRLLADTYAAHTGMRVLIPDVIPGVGMSPAILPLMDTLSSPVAWYNLPGQLARIATLTKVLLIGIPFMIRASPKKALPGIVGFAQAVRKDLPPGGKLGVCGFCWGGNPSTALCTQPAFPGSKGRLIDAHFCAHPSRVDTPAAFVEAVARFKVPFSLAAAENDGRLKMADVDELEARLRESVGGGEGENGCWFEVVRYEGCGHGFAVRAGPGNEVEMRGAEKACEQAVQWFKRWL